MEQSTSEEDMHSLFTEEELGVSQILLDLGSVIEKSEFRGCWPLTWSAKKILVWGPKKRRSSIDSGLSAANLGTSPASSSPSVQKTLQNEYETKTSEQVKDEATSPSTPLAFSPSESDDKSRHCYRKNSKKRTREELLKTVKELTENTIALRGELERVKSHYNKVLAYNRDLKAMKKQVESTMICHRREEPQLEINQSYHLGLRLGRSYQISVVPVAHHQHKQRALMANPRAAELSLQRRAQYHQHYPYAQVTPPLFSSSSGLGRVNHVGPLKTIPDLNVSAEENCRMDSFQPLDYSRALAVADKRARYAEARRERQMKRKNKHSRK